MLLPPYEFVRSTRLRHWRLIIMEYKVGLSPTGYHTKFQKCLDWFRGMAQVVHGHGTFSYKRENQTTDFFRGPPTTTEAYRDSKLGPLLRSVASTTACWWITDEVCIMTEAPMLQWKRSEVRVRTQVWTAQEFSLLFLSYPGKFYDNTLKHPTTASFHIFFESTVHYQLVTVQAK